MYAFERALVAGGKMVVDRLAKVRLHQHLTILRQLAAPSFPASISSDIKQMNGPR
ncbi:T6SS immunity protein Tdi1 domain-containing protein [Burkholderia sp. LMG 13014]